MHPQILFSPAPSKSAPQPTTDIYNTPLHSHNVYPHVVPSLPSLIEDRISGLPQHPRINSYHIYIIGYSYVSSPPCSPASVPWNSSSRGIATSLRVWLRRVEKVPSWDHSSSPSFWSSPRDLFSTTSVDLKMDYTLAWSDREQARPAYPSTVRANARMESTIGPFVRKSLEINNLLVEIFNEKLGLPPGVLMDQHKMEEFSGSETRITRNPPTTNVAKQAISGYFPFFTTVWAAFKFLFQDPIAGTYPKPRHLQRRGRAGHLQWWDLRSNLHRVLPPPGSQAGLERWSLVYFTRPGNSVVLRALVENSPLIAEAVSKTPEKNYETGATAFEWFTRRIKNQRINNRKKDRYGSPKRRIARATQFASYLE
ncbi:unnamed protein product [Cyclocybe aegerita]|uniref:Uncharacterized protein n=1 Tax=Cyclocybe aegerita TaxID=1973307 RepID=A0A8S0WB02_CYCAE|nr:unnamed protein product [Cyclocybe aegerita]